jgi:hypothetical protein
MGKWGGAAVIAVLCACGGAQPAGTAQQPGVLITLDPGGTGAGRITSTPAGIDCPGQCGLRLQPGAVLTLFAAPADGSRFDGFGGACEGLTCTLRAAADAVVHATFSTVEAAPAPHRHTLVVVPSGNGTVTSTPPGIACPGACSAVFEEGTNVALSAASEDDLTWGGECTGAGACSVTLLRDATVTARFDDPCANLMPAALPDPVEVRFQGLNRGGQECVPPITDGAGTVWGKLAGFFAALAVGETYYTQQMSATGTFEVWDGQTLVNEIVYTPNDVAGLTANGGVVFASAECFIPEIDGPIQIRKLDAWGHVASDVLLADEACPEDFFAVAVDALDRTVVLSADHVEGRMSARWFDAEGQPLTVWFDVGPAFRGGYWWNWPGWGGNLYPLPGGGVALRERTGFDSGGWLATLPSGKAELQPPPKGFTGLTVRTLRSGKGFAFPGPDAVQIVSATGKACGSLPVGNADVGRDGSIVVGHPLTDHACTATVYPRALQ